MWRLGGTVATYMEVLQGRMDKQSERSFDMKRNFHDLHESMKFIGKKLGYFKINYSFSSRKISDVV